MNSVKRLLRLGSESIRPRPIDDSAILGAFGGIALKQLERLLQFRNGFYAFESALHVFSDKGWGGEPGLLAWNSDSLWRGEYRGMAGSAIFFAEDVFGCQFCLVDGVVSLFDPETAEFEVVAADVDGWAGKVMGDYELWTGHRLARDWQQVHGSIPVGSRLAPITPFVLGGAYSIENLQLMESSLAMRFRASVAVQVRGLPDGAQVVLRTGVRSAPS